LDPKPGPSVRSKGPTVQIKHKRKETVTMNPAIGADRKTSARSTFPVGSHRNPFITCAKRKDGINSQDIQNTEKESQREREREREMVLWEITLGTAYFLGLKRTFRLALRIQRKVVSAKHPKIRQFLYR